MYKQNAAHAPDNLPQNSPMAFSDFVIAPSPQLKLNPYSANEHRATQWSLITWPFNVTPIFCHNSWSPPTGLRHRWQGLIGLTDRCQASWHVMANKDKREREFSASRPKLNRHQPNTPNRGEVNISCTLGSLHRACTFLMDIMVL